MSKLIYRVVCACGALGYGFPKASMDKAIEGRIDAIVSDAGSMDAGPFYLGTGTQYFEREAVKADYTHMVRAGLATGAPVILGSCGMAGGDRNLQWMLDVAKEVFAELGVRDARVATISAELAPELVIRELKAGALLPAGDGPQLHEAALRDSVIAGRSCDVALFEESHPQLQFYPEGVLLMDQTEFFARDARSAGIRGSRFVHAGAPWPWSIKLEGAHRLGARKVSLIHIDAADLPKVPAEVLVYGRNGVSSRPVQAGERELGLIVETTAKTQDAAETLASLLTHYLIHFGYVGRKATAGNIAYPLSPNLLSFRREDGLWGAIVPSGTRDPVFFRNYARVKAGALASIEAGFPEALANAGWRIIEADAEHPAVLLRTIDTDPARLAERHAADIAALTRVLTPEPDSHLNIDAAGAYEWSLYHLLQNEAVIKDTMFPITTWHADGAAWVKDGELRPRWFDIGLTDFRGELDDRTLSLIADAPPRRRAGADAAAAGHGGGHPQQECRHQPADLRHRVPLQRRLRGRAALQPVPQGAGGAAAGAGGRARGRQLLRRQLQRHQDHHQPAQALGLARRARRVRRAAAKPAGGAVRAGVRASPGRRVDPLMAACMTGPLSIRHRRLRQRGGAAAAGSGGLAR